MLVRSFREQNKAFLEVNHRTAVQRRICIDHFQRHSVSKYAAPYRRTGFWLGVMNSACFSLSIIIRFSC